METYTTGDYTYIPKTKTIKRITKTIEKYGPGGEYLGKEIITTDEENIEVQDLNWYSGTITVVGDGSNLTDISSSSTQWDPNNTDIPWSYTSSIN